MRGRQVTSALVALFVLIGSLHVLRLQEHRSDGGRQSQRPLNHSPTQKQRLIVLTAYTHGGSTVVSTLLGKNPNSLYIYEPNILLYNAVLKLCNVYAVRSLFHPNNSVRTFSPVELKMQKLLLESASTCQTRPLISAFQRKTGANLTNCISPNRYFSTLTGQSTHAHNKPDPLKGINLKFIKRATRGCKQKQYVSIKILRYDLGPLLKLVKEMDNVQHVHLIRDPRGIVNSFIRRKYSALSVQTLAARFCGAMKQHLQLLKEHGMSDNVIRYEDFTKSPVKFTVKLYRHLSINLPSEVKDYAYQSTHSEKDSGATYRVNASHVANAWKQKLTKHELKIIDDKCAHLYHYFD